MNTTIYKDKRVYKPYRHAWMYISYSFNKGPRRDMKLINRQNVGFDIPNNIVIIKWMRGIEEPYSRKPRTASLKKIGSVIFGLIFL